MNYQSQVKVIGIYGVPGSGKTRLLANMREKFGSHAGYTFFEGSRVINDVVPGGIEKFFDLPDMEKASWRKCAIQKIKEECLENNSDGVVAGHFMFWPDEQKSGNEVHTEEDWKTYTHIIYLDVPANVVVQRCHDDTTKRRQAPSVSQLEKWQESERTDLRNLCMQHGILFYVLTERDSILDDAFKLLKDFQVHDEKYNLLQACKHLDSAFENFERNPETVLVFDGDKTLIEGDTGELFWNSSSFYPFQKEESPLRTLFSSKLGYSYSAFRQAMLLYEEGYEEEGFDEICQEVVTLVEMRPELKTLLQLAAGKQHIHVFIVTCGLRNIWNRLLQKEGLAGSVDVIAGGRLANGYVITAHVKTELVKHLQQRYQAFVWAFGDSTLDIGMLSRADEAIVVAGTKRTRSKGMTSALQIAIETGCVQARQLLFPSTAPLRLDAQTLPLVSLSDRSFVNSILHRRSDFAASKVVHNTKAIHAAEVVHATERNAAKILMTPMRNAEVDGPRLRKAHSNAGRYLATEFVSEIIGTEEFEIPHVQAHQTTGYRLLNERETVIIALMRGGEPMAFGVGDVFPLAMFLHANQPNNVRPEHLAAIKNIVLVDSVINSGKTASRFIHRIRQFQKNASVVIVAGVIQEDAVLKGELADMITNDPKLDVVTLRLSENKYTGRGGTDTGNRLFNTTHIFEVAA